MAGDEDTALPETEPPGMRLGDQAAAALIKSFRDRYRSRRLEDYHVGSELIARGSTQPTWLAPPSSPKEMLALAETMREARERGEAKIAADPWERHRRIPWSAVRSNPQNPDVIDGPAVVQSRPCGQPPSSSRSSFWPYSEPSSPPCGGAVRFTPRTTRRSFSSTGSRKHGDPPPAQPPDGCRFGRRTTWIGCPARLSKSSVSRWLPRAPSERRRAGCPLS